MKTKPYEDLYSILPKGIKIDTSVHLRMFKKIWRYNWQDLQQHPLQKKFAALFVNTLRGMFSHFWWNHSQHLIHSTTAFSLSYWHTERHGQWILSNCWIVLHFKTLFVLPCFENGFSLLQHSFCSDKKIKEKMLNINSNAGHSILHWDVTCNIILCSFVFQLSYP